MLEGIEILNQYTKDITEITNKNAVIITVIIWIILSSIMFMSFEWKTDSKISLLSLTLGIVAGLAIGSIFGIEVVAKEEVVRTDIYYEIQFTQEVSFEEFYNRYEIIEQRGKIYTIKEKDVTNNGI